MARQSVTEKRALQSVRLAAVMAADPRMRARDEARRARDDAAALAIESRSKRVADAKVQAKARMTEAEREKARAKAKRERDAAKRRAVREAAAEKLKAEKAAAREVAKNAAASAKRAALKEAWHAEAAAAIARGEPFADDDEQKVYMEAKRSAGWRAAKLKSEREEVPELVTDEGEGWDEGSAPW